MNKLLARLSEDDFTLLVSLPRNDVRLAEAAVRGGAQGLKVHLNVHHHASGTHFGSFQDERASLEKIVAVAGDAAVGIVPGGSPFATLQEFQELAAMGIDFFDAYPAEAPAWTLAQQHLGRMLAAFEGGSLEEMVALRESGMQMCEASIVSQQDYGKLLTALDVARYRRLASEVAVPVIVPSQKHIVTDDLPALRSSGVKGVLIGAIVTGKEAQSLEAATRSFSEALRSP